MMSLKCKFLNTNKAFSPSSQIKSILFNDPTSIYVNVRIFIIHKYIVSNLIYSQLLKELKVFTLRYVFAAVTMCVISLIVIAPSEMLFGFEEFRIENLQK